VSFLNFDWGSQSIAQSKFSKSFQLRKDENQTISLLVSQEPFRNYFEEFLKQFGETFRSPSLSDICFPDAFQSKGRENMAFQATPASLF